MIYKVLADIVILIHFTWILFLIFGAFGGVKNKAIKIFHISGLLFAVSIEAFNWYCPLTHLEIWLRSKHDSSTAYTGSFIAYYVERLIYIDFPSYSIKALSALVCIFNAWFYTKRAC